MASPPPPLLLTSKTPFASHFKNVSVEASVMVCLPLNPTATVFAGSSVMPLFKLFAGSVLTVEITWTFKLPLPSVCKCSLVPLPSASVFPRIWTFAEPSVMLVFIVSCLASVAKPADDNSAVISSVPSALHLRKVLVLESLIFVLAFISPPPVVPCIFTCRSPLSLTSALL